MKSILTKTTLAMVCLVLGLASCKKEGCTDENALNYNEKAKKDNGTCEYPVQEDTLKVVTTLTNSTHTIDLLTIDGTLKTGYNNVYFRIKNASGNLVTNATATWLPTMHMTSMSHSCPFSTISSSSGLYKGYIVFQMATNASEYWDLKIDYQIDGTSYSATKDILVTESSKKVVNSVLGSDGIKYVVALVEPKKPSVGTNTMKAVIFKMMSMQGFVPVSNYTLKIDPRMPGMGNHSSPNNVHLTQLSDAFYAGSINLTMTGYWRVNLQLVNDTGTTVKGEEVTGSVTESSLYFEIEF